MTYIFSKREMPKYKVVKCGKCGHVQITEAAQYLQCKYCTKRTALRKEGRWNLQVFIVTDSASDARRAYFDETGREADLELGTTKTLQYW